MWAYFALRAGWLKINVGTNLGPQIYMYLFALGSLHGAKIFSKIDLNAGYHQLSLAEQSRHLTTFSTHRGLRRYTRLNFGTNSAAEQFQQAIQQTLSGIPGVMNISDDIIVFGADKAAHNQAMEQCFARLEENGLTINRKKCEFYKDKLDFMV